MNARPLRKPVTDTDREIAQAFVAWAADAFPLHGDDTPQDEWDRIAAAFCAGWLAGRGETRS